MTCDNECLPKQTLCTPKGDDRFFIITLRDTSGATVDLVGADEIEFTVYENDAGGAEVFSKTLSGGDISIAGTGYQFSFWINDTDSAAVVSNHAYFECELTDSTGRKFTIGSGLFRSPATRI